MNNLIDLLDGVELWSKKIDEISQLGLPVEDFYTHLKKEVTELDEGRNEGEMIDVINCVAMLYTASQYKVTFRDCYNKLKVREEKYEQRRETP